MFYHLQETTSTNDEARRPQYRHGDLIRAERQTAGRGQRGHTWSSNEGENLTFSVVLEPHFLAAARQFLLSEAVALALTDTFADFGIDTRIKWTNDIYAGDRKITGILIEHYYSGTRLERTIAGIGVNVNQTEFDPALPNPVSMRLAAGTPFDREEVLERLYERLMQRYAQLERGEEQALCDDYRRRLYMLDTPRTFRLPDGSTVRAAIRSVKPTGELMLEHDDGSLRGYLFREIEFVLNTDGRP